MGDVLLFTKREANRARNARWRAAHVERKREQANRYTAKKRAERLALKAAQPPATTKRCASCKTEKTFDAFGKNRARKCGLHSYCKSCCSVKNATLDQAGLERKRAASRRHHAAHRQEYSAAGKAYSLRKRAENPQLVRETHRRLQKQWKINNPELAKAGEKRRQARVSKEKKRAYLKKWRDSNPERARLVCQKKELTRRAKKKAAFVEVVDPLVVFQRDNGVCGICRVGLLAGDKWHIDHIVPLSAGGVHAYANVQLAHALCNIKKGARAA